MKIWFKNVKFSEKWLKNVKFNEKRLKKGLANTNT